MQKSMVNEKIDEKLLSIKTDSVKILIHSKHSGLVRPVSGGQTGGFALNAPCGDFDHYGAMFWCVGSFAAIINTHRSARAC